MTRFIRSAVVGAVLAVVLVSAVPALATPGKSARCSDCHEGSGVTVSLSVVSITASDAKYQVATTGADAVAVFEGATKLVRIDAPSGEFTVPTGKTYVVYAVDGPSTGSGIAVTSVSPVAPAVDTIAPTTSSDAQFSYAATATIHLMPKDTGGTGVAATYHRLDGGPQVAGTVVVVGATGSHTLEFWSIDKAGNVELFRSADFTVGLVAPSSLSAKASDVKVAYNGTTAFTGVLSGVAGLAGRTVRIQSSADKVVWRDTAASSVTDGSGAYRLAVSSKRTTHYRVVFAGDEANGTAASAAFTVRPKVHLSKPSGPLSVRKGVTFSSSGYLKPRHAAGTYPVTIKAYRYQSGAWKLRKTVLAKASDYEGYSKYKKRFSLPYKGKWRIRAYHAADADNAATYSSYRYITVK